jgi:NRAMP (natural resistance-associated macrophage protein)-like metal ion transporter
MAGAISRRVEKRRVRLAPSETKNKSILKVLGPGLITGASDDDPSGIGTYSQAGARFGYDTLWTMLATYPLMSAVQLISATIARVTGRGIAGNMRNHVAAPLMYASIGLMLIADIVNIGADVAAMGAAAQLLVGGPALLYAAILAVGSLLLQIFVSYRNYVRILKWLTLALFAYVGSVFAVKIPWAQALKGLLVPTISFNAGFLTMLAAIFGTTISPYLFFWQASQEVEEVKTKKADKPLVKAPEQARTQLRRIDLDTFIGMAASNVIAIFIILTTAATLHASGKTEIGSAAQAAEALRPIAGPFAFLLFSLGIIGTGLLALPVLAGSAAYGVGEALRWRTGLEAKPNRARKFYWLLAVIMIAGLSLNLIHLDPIKALFWSAVINGVVCPPIMVSMMLIASNREAMKQFTISPRLKAMGWFATAVMTLISVGSIVTALSGQ